MLCTSCGKELPADALHCPACGTARNASAKTAAAGPGVADKIKAASADSLNAFKSFAVNPVGELANVYNSLGETRALGVGITFGVISAIGFTLGTVLTVMHLPQMFRPDGVGWILKSLIWSCIPFVSMAAACFGARSVFRGVGGLPTDTFIAGAALLPPALVFLINGLIGSSSYQLLGALAIFAGCLSVFILFIGFVRIEKLTERASTFIVPIVILLSLWLSYVINSALMKSQSAPTTINF